MVHVVTTSPVCLYSMDTSSYAQHMTCMDLADVFAGGASKATHYPFHQPRLRLAAFSGAPLESSVVIHDQLTNMMFCLNWQTGQLARLQLGGNTAERVAQKLARGLRPSQQTGVYEMVRGDFADDNETGRLLFYRQDSDSINVVSMAKFSCHTVWVPFSIQSVLVASPFDWLITESAVTHRKYLLSNTPDNPFTFTLSSVDDETVNSFILGDEIELMAPRALSDLHLSAALQQRLKSPHRVFATPRCHAALAVGFPDCPSSDVYVSPRAENGELEKSSPQPGRTSLRSLVYLPESGQLARLLPTPQLPVSIIPQDEKSSSSVSAYLEVSDIVNRHLRYVPVPAASNHSIYDQWYYRYAGAGSTDMTVLLAALSNEGLVTVDSGGCVRLWQTSVFSLTESLARWRTMIGNDSLQHNLQVTYGKELSKLPTAPKHGQIDPTGAPHVGGNTFAGGTGGADTAGLGGVGGPYRLDVGHDVYQLSDLDKAQLPLEVRRAARDLAERAWKERLRQIRMSEADGELYERFSSSVRAQVKALHVILDTLQAKGKERQWLRHQMTGDLDESKLIEGLTGEKGIYKRRADREPELGSMQQKPKLVRVECDVSASMYRFNGQDARMDRQLETVLMVMETFDSYQHKIKYEVFGHSGEGFGFPFVNVETPPKNMKERLDVLLALHAHSQFCLAGDNTLKAAKHAIESVVKHAADEHFVIVLSDANLERYAISPRRLAEIITVNDDVSAYVIFIGSLGDQAQRIMKQMPAGRAFICLQTSQLPSIMQQIFTSTTLLSNT